MCVCVYSGELDNLHLGRYSINISLFLDCAFQVPSFEKKHGLWPCMVAPTKIIAGLGLSLGIDILEAPGATGDYRTLLTSKATAIANALSAPLNSCPNVFVPGEDEKRPGRSDGYDFGFLHIKVIAFRVWYLFVLLSASHLQSSFTSMPSEQGSHFFFIFSQ